jgi:hypothetical protein
MITEEIKKNIIKELGLENFSAEKAEEVMTKLEQNIERNLTLEVLDLLTLDDQQEFMKIAETESDEDVKSFLETKISNFDSLAKAVAESVVKEFKDLAR